MMDTKLWRLEPIEDVPGSPHVKADCVSFFIVRAANESVARQLASEQAADETPECWLNPAWSTCVEYEFPSKDGLSEVVWSEFCPG